MNENANKSISWWELIKRTFIAIIFLNVVISMIPNIKKSIQEMNSTKTKVALININGMIATSSGWVKEIRHAIANPEAKAILLRIDSGGGAPGTSELVMRELVRAKKHKPVIALVENICASGAYMIAAPTYIIGQATSGIGSIGVISIMMKFKKLTDHYNLESDAFFAGKYKGMSNPLDGKMSPEHRKHWQELLDETYASFKGLVSEHRPKLDLQNSEIWAEGKIFSGEKALQLGLIDEIGDLGSAEDAIRNATGITDTEIEYVYYPKKSPIAQMLSGRDDGEGDAPTGLPQSMFAMVWSVLFNQAQASQNNQVLLQ